MSYIRTAQDLEEARKLFERIEPRSLFYRAATDLVAFAIQGQSSLTVAEALAVLLQTWNSAYYRFHGLDHEHFAHVEHLWDDHRQTLMDFRVRFIRSFGEDDKPIVRTIFAAFENVLGPVGAAKALHLLAPQFFPLWDRAIAAAYGCAIQTRGANGTVYCKFMGIAQQQCAAFETAGLPCPNLLKALDEYNYCRYTRGLIK